MNTQEMIEALDFKRHSELQEVKNICRACNGEYIALSKRGKLITTGFCNPCSEIEVARFMVKEKEENHSRRVQKFREFCPDMYFTLDPSKLPNINCYQKVMTGLRTRRGLILIGGSRLGKTRSAYALLKGLYLEMGKSCYALTELQLSHELSKFGRSDATMNLLDKMCAVDYLLIDDLGKSVMTQRVVSELFYVIEERISHYKQTIVTMQIDSRSFQDKMAQSSGGDIAEAIVKRLRENCDVINFEEFSSTVKKHLLAA